MKNSWRLLLGVLLIAGPCRLTWAQAPTSQEKQDVVVAKVGDKAITLGDVVMRMREMPVAGGDTAEQKKRAVEKMAEEIIFYQGAVAEGIDKDAEIAGKIENFKRGLVVAAYKNKLRDKVKPASVEETKAYYEKNKSKYAEPAQFKLSQIVVKTEGSAKEVLGLLKQGKDFASTAKEKSMDEMTKTRGGELGWFSAGMPLPYFDQSLMTQLNSLKKGDLSPIIQTNTGFHIIKIDDLKLERLKSYEEVAEQAKGDYFNAELKKLEEQIKQELKTKTKVEIYYEKLQ